MKNWMRRRQKGEGPIWVIIMIGILITLIAALFPWVSNPTGVLSAQELLRQLGNYGYTAYASPAGDFYVNDLLPNADSTYDVGATDNEFAEGHFDNLFLTGVNPIELVGAGKVWLEIRADIDPTKLSVNAKPTIITRGDCIGYSLPVGGADEELYLSQCVPDRWDGESNVHVHVFAWLDTAQNEAADVVELTLSWSSIGEGEIVPASGNPSTLEVVTGIIAQYTVIEFEFDLDYDVEPADPIEGDDTLFLHIVRSASSHEIEGELVIYEVGMIYECDKIGSTTP